MILSRRRIIGLVGSVAVTSSYRHAFASDYPTRPVRILVGYSAGGVSDIVARLLAQKLSERLGQSFIVENKPGAASNVAASLAIHAAPDGYTLFLAGISNAINVALYNNLDFDFVRDVSAIGLISRSPLVMMVSPSFPAATVPEFIAYAKQRPGTLNMASTGVGGATHVGGELFQMLADIKMTHVPYRGSPPAQADLLGGRIDVMFDNIAAAIGLIRAGKLRALAVSSQTDALPDVPPISRFLPGYEAYVWNGLVAPRGCPAEIIQKLNAEMKTIANDTSFQAQLSQVGNAVEFDTAAEFAKLIADETIKWGNVVKFANIQPQ
jgi:tripartite-type tricarboxylate transporter receptor subunit TctC